MEENIIADLSDHFSGDIKSLFAFNPNGIKFKLLVKEMGFLIDDIAYPEQIHSNKVMWVEKPGKYSSIDGLVTANPNLVISLKTADCVPVFFYDYKNSIISLVHAGWRGTVKGIILETLNLMKNKGANIKSTRVYLGPSIHSCCYEVDYKVAVLFSNDSKYKIDNNKWKVDLSKEISLQLVKEGISYNNISYSEICTFESLKCHSYRRDGEHANRMYSFMGMK